MWSFILSLAVILHERCVRCVVYTDRAMHLNYGLFATNGNCGYVLKPPCMLMSNFDPYDKQSLQSVDPLTVSLNVSAFQCEVSTTESVYLNRYQ